MLLSLLSLLLLLLLLLSLLSLSLLSLSLLSLVVVSTESSLLSSLLLIIIIITIISIVCKQPFLPTMEYDSNMHRFPLLKVRKDEKSQILVTPLRKRQCYILFAHSHLYINHNILIKLLHFMRHIPVKMMETHSLSPCRRRPTWPIRL